MYDPNYEVRPSLPEPQTPHAPQGNPFYRTPPSHSYPVIPSAPSNLPPQVAQSDQLAYAMQAEANANRTRKETAVAYILWFFLGGFGGHRFYLGKIGSAIAMLLITLISIPLTIVVVGDFGLFAVFIWWIVDAFLIPGWVRAHNDLARRRAYGV